MSFHIEDLLLVNFRGYKKLELGNFLPFVIIVGPNAAGKTNIIEALQLLTTGYSFRNPKVEELISWKKDNARALIHLKDEKRQREHLLEIKENKRSYKINGKQKNLNFLQGVCPSVLFTPDDLQIVKASSAVRRDELDYLGIQLSETYANIKRDYEKTLKQRNLLLKDEKFDQKVFDSWNENFLIYASRLSLKRRDLFIRLSKYICSIYKKIIPYEKPSFSYIFSWERIDDKGHTKKEKIQNKDIFCKQYSLDFILTKLQEKDKEIFFYEKQRKISLLGSHKDEICLFLNGVNTRTYASQGQQRSMTLILKLAELELIREIKQQKPILLLDDIMSEFDKTHSDAFLTYICQAAQCFITTTSLSPFSSTIQKNANIIHLPIKGTRYKY